VRLVKGSGTASLPCVGAGADGGPVVTPVLGADVPPPVKTGLLIR